MGNKVIVSLDKIETKTESGIYIHTGNSEEREYAAQTRGTLKALGPEAWLDIDTGIDLPWKLEVGDRVLFAAYAGVRIEQDKYGDRIMNDHDIIARIDREWDENE